jgi:hypothetical protein
MNRPPSLEWKFDIYGLSGKEAQEWLDYIRHLEQELDVKRQHQFSREQVKTIEFLIDQRIGNAFKLIRDKENGQ